jgi:hypothetical protein
MPSKYTEGRNGERIKPQWTEPQEKGAKTSTNKSEDPNLFFFLISLCHN